MDEFRSWLGFRHFARSVRQKNRYILDDSQKVFLEGVKATCRSRLEGLGKGTRLWRAQLGYCTRPVHMGDGEYYEEPCAFPQVRMKPPRDRAAEGRANPKGIPHLYLATNQDTAMGEVRPWVGSLISIGMFRTDRDLELINCSGDITRVALYWEEPEPAEREAAVWADINSAFSRPITPSENVADYAATQILAELFKNNDVDGIKYLSSLGSGTNIVLFDLDAASLVKCGLYEVKCVDFSFRQSDNPYYVRRQSSADIP